MSRKALKPLSACVGLVAVAVLAWAPPTQARVSKIVLSSPVAVGTPPGCSIAYEQIRGQAWGELDPLDPHNAIITDIGLAPLSLSGNPATPGKMVAKYVATFTLTKPADMALASGFMWHDVPNRGGNIAIVNQERCLGDVGLASAWQGDNAGATAVPTGLPLGSNTSSHWVQVPVAVNPSIVEVGITPTGLSVTTPVVGNILGRIINRSGPGAQPLNVMGNPIPYFPVSTTDNTGATLTTHTKETLDGVITVGSVIPNSDWKYCATGGTFASPGTVTSLPVNVCLSSGFDPALLYQLVYPVQNPYVLGVGTAAFRDVNSFFRYSTVDDLGTANPLAPGGTKKIKWATIRGVSQSGNFTRHFIHLGMNQDESNRIVHEGAWPIIAGRRVANNSRWGQPDGVLELYQQGSEGPQWWTDWPDTVRGLPTRGIFDRCMSSATCPVIVEHFGGSEVFALKMTMEWVGTSATSDIPLARNVRRYYVGSTTHGGGGGGFAQITSPTFTGANCPGNNWNAGVPATYRANPVPETELVNVLRLAMRNWVMNGVPPPPSKYPTIGGGTLVDPTKAAMGFPDIPDSPAGYGPGVPLTIFDPANFVNPVFDYDWGPGFDHSDGTGNPTNIPPTIKHVIKMKVPKVNADGNELGGVPTVLTGAPLGTYMGWNLTNTGFHSGQVCNYVGGYIPFSYTMAQRLALSPPDLRLSLQERYGSHAGYVAAVKAAANAACLAGYLNASSSAASDASTAPAACQKVLPTGTTNDWVVLVNAAILSNVCSFAGGTSCDPAAGP